MTLLEIMIVVAIMGLVTAVVGVSVIRIWDRSRRNIAHTQIARYKDAVHQFNFAYRRYPTTNEGLAILSLSRNGEPPVMEMLSADPWGQDYIYVCPGAHNTWSFDITSVGPDGVSGTDDDINSWSKTAP